MHVVAWGALRTARRPHLWRACRVVAGVRRPLPSRNFHRSAIAYRIPEDPPIPPTGAEDGGPGKAEAGKKEEGNAAPEASEPVVKTDAVAGGQRSRQRGDHGSAMRRANRNVRVKEVPPMMLPEWFLEHNIRPNGGIGKDGRILLWRSDDSFKKWYQGPPSTAEAFTPLDMSNMVSDMDMDVEAQRRTIAKAKPGFVELSVEKDLDGVNHKLQATAADATLDYDRSGRYSIHVNVYGELLSSINTVLSLRPPKGVEPKEILRPDILLQCPKHDGIAFMNQVVDTVAYDLKADIVRLDPDDLAQIVGEYMGENLAWTSCSTALLGYELDKVSRYEEEMNRNEDEDVEMDADEDEEPGKPDTSSMKALTSALKAGSSKLRGLTVIPGPGGQNMSSKPMSFDELFGQGPNQTPSRSTSSSESWSNFKLTAALEALVDASYNKANQSNNLNHTEEPTGTENVAPNPIIIHINQYKEMGKVDAGINILKMLRGIVKKRWLEGRNILIVGTTTAGDPVPANTYNSIVQLQSDIVFGDQRTIMVTPARSPLNTDAFKADEKDRIRSINIRHIKDMIAKFSNNEKAEALTANVDTEIPATRKVPALSASPEWGFDAIHIAEALEESIWTYPRVHRLATTMLGLPEPKYLVGNSSLSCAYDMIQKSDEDKALWVHEHEKRKSPKIAVKDTRTDQKLKQVKASCSKHEQKLLGGLVDPSDIHTTFADVRAPTDIIEALKTLTSLSLIRPEAFSYGVLAKDKIPGVLLYGPPGTGKTLLAKAVAKDSGTTVLEVSGSEIYDKYVGEGEKNVKAVFSLAKKLSPCIVFIDEADAIFGDRGSGRERTSHREIINQFLREWDGMNDLSAFIMVATNRPFDLDEAILRRLPRRLLIDLPVEADREAILKIHLKDESLDPSVSLAAIASNTPFYSGSDLKNLSVAAALACVREENAAATAEALAAGIDESSLKGNLIYPEKRTLQNRHFDIATQEISASISEDMETLSAIRKFDERYGDRKGRRKKRMGMGFGKEKETVDEEAARVRQRDATGKGA